MFLVRVLIASIITVATAYGCYPVADPQGGEDGFDHRETRTRTSVGPGFDSPHLHTVGGGGGVVPHTNTTTLPPAATPTTTTTTTLFTFPPYPEPFYKRTPDPLYQQYNYYERSQRVTALQMDLGMRSVDGIYGPQTRRAHIEELGGPAIAILIFHPEIWENPTPCSHGCLPGDGHYELPTLGALINKYFLPEDKELALKIAFCESSGRSWDIGSTEVSHAFAVGWFQHLAKYWPDRSEKAGWGEYHPFHGEANVAVASWLFYSSGVHHWNPSKACWGSLSD